jgi:hypothetical protein
MHLCAGRGQEGNIVAPLLGVSGLYGSELGEGMVHTSIIILQSFLLLRLNVYYAYKMSCMYAGAFVACVEGSARACCCPESSGLQVCRVCRSWRGSVQGIGSSASTQALMLRWVLTTLHTMSGQIGACWFGTRSVMCRSIS